MDEEEMMRQMGFASFGQKLKKDSKTIKIQELKIKKEAREEIVSKPEVERNIQVKPTETEQNKVSNEEEDEVSDASSNDDNIDPLPLVTHASLFDHSRSVTTLSLDPSHSRLLTGSRDNYIKLWDFNTMRGRFKPFITVEPAEGSPIKQACWSKTGDSFLVAPSNWQVMLFDREGGEVCSFTKGDPYLRDLRHVKGHTSTLSGVQWDPIKANRFMSFGMDGTTRFWEIEDRRGSKACIYNPRGPKVGITDASFSNDAKKVVTGDMKGIVRVWKGEGDQTRPLMVLEGHTDLITSTIFSKNGYNIVTRSLDATVKLWDMRSPKQYVKSHSGLSTNEESNVCYSPNERYILAGTASVGPTGPGALQVFDKNLEKVVEIETPSSCVKILYPPRMEQIFCGLGSGEVYCLLDDVKSTGGMIRPLLNNNKKLAVDDYDKFMGGVDASGEILEPEEPVDPRNPVKTTWTKDRNRTKPEQPYTMGTRGKKGMIGMNMTGHIMTKILKNETRMEDPREALLKHAEAAEKEPFWVAPAYKKNQSKTILAESVYEDKAEEYRESKKQRRK